MDLCVRYGQYVHVRPQISSLQSLDSDGLKPLTFYVKFKFHDVECYLFESGRYARVFRSPHLSDPVISQVFHFTPNDQDSWTNISAAILDMVGTEPEVHKAVMSSLVSIVNDSGCRCSQIEVCLNVWRFYQTRVPPPLSGVEVIPRLERLKDEEIQVKDEKCAICLEGLKDGVNEEDGIFKDAVAVRLAFCKHVFHEGCILAWLYNSLLCPICRASI